MTTECRLINGCSFPATRPPLPGDDPGAWDPASYKSLPLNRNPASISQHMLLRTATRISIRPFPSRVLLNTTSAQFLPLQTTASSARIQQSRTMVTEIKQISTPKAAQPVAPYSQAVQAGPHIFVSGQIPADASGKLIEGSIADKTTACCEGLKNILEAAGSDISRVVKVTVFLTSMENFAEMNGVYEKYFGEHKPSRSCVAVKELPKGVPVELECIALSKTG